MVMVVSIWQGLAGCRIVKTAQLPILEFTCYLLVKWRLLLHLILLLTKIYNDKTTLTNPIHWLEIII